ncbi:MAG: hypothetical protein GXP27_07590 [Planctomycetes bacterium]|nr:hypothetical protein [Planctomycetota bacterium]
MPKFAKIEDEPEANERPLGIIAQLKAELEAVDSEIRQLEREAGESLARAADAMSATNEAAHGPEAAAFLATCEAEKHLEARLREQARLLREDRRPRVVERLRALETEARALPGEVRYASKITANLRATRAKLSYEHERAMEANRQNTRAWERRKDDKAARLAELTGEQVRSAAELSADEG